MRYYYFFFCTLIESEPLTLPSERSPQIKNYARSVHIFRPKKKNAQSIYATGHLISDRWANSFIPCRPHCEPSDKEKEECGCKGGPVLLLKEVLVVARDWLATHYLVSEKRFTSSGYEHIQRSTPPGHWSFFEYEYFHIGEFASHSNPLVFRVNLALCTLSKRWERESVCVCVCDTHTRTHCCISRTVCFVIPSVFISI